MGVVFLPLTSLWGHEFKAIRWIENNIEGKYTFEELNVGLTAWKKYFNPAYHNCIKISFSEKIDKEYFILVWGEYL